MAKLIQAEEVHPDYLLCPILGTLMADPVVAADGHTYERSAITEWFKTSNISPMTGVPLESKTLIPTYALRKSIDDYCAGKPDRQANRESSRKPEFIAVKISKGPTTRPGLTSASAGRKVQPTESSDSRPPWEFDKKLLATKSVHEKRPVVLCASRTSLYSGEGVLVAFEPTADGNEFVQAFSHTLKIERQYSGDASMACIQRISDDTFVSGTRDGSVSVWKLERNSSSGKLLPKRTWQAKDNFHGDETTCVAFIPAFDLLGTGSTSSLIASGSRDRTVRLWKNVGQNSWEYAETLDHRDEVKCITGLSEGQVLSGGADWDLKLWDPNVPNEPVQVFSGHSRTVRCVSTERAGGKRVASGSDDENIIIWDPRSPDPILTKIETGSPVLTLHWGEDFLCAGGGTAADSMTGASGEIMGGWLRFWDPRNWQVISDAILPQVNSRMSKKASSSGPASEKIFRARSAHEMSTNGLSSFTLAGNKAVISGGDDKQLRIWLSPPMADVSFSPKPTLAYELGGEKVLPIAVDAIATLFV